MSQKTFFTKTLLPIVTIFISLLSAQSPLASPIDLVCKYEYSVWVMTDSDGVEPPFGLMKQKIVSTHPDDTKDISLQIGPIIGAGMGMLTHDHIPEIVYRTEGNEISYNLETKLGGKAFLKYSHTLDRVSGQLDIVTKGRAVDKERCKQFYTCDSEGFVETSTKTHKCTKSVRLF